MMTRSCLFPFSMFGTSIPVHVLGCQGATSMQVDSLAELAGAYGSLSQQEFMNNGSASTTGRTVVLLRNLAKTVFLAYTLLRVMSVSFASNVFQRRDCYASSSGALPSINFALYARHLLSLMPSALFSVLSSS